MVCEERGDGFEGILLQLRPVECLVEGGGVGGFREILEKNHIALTECKKSWFIINLLIIMYSMYLELFLDHYDIHVHS